MSTVRSEHSLRITARPVARVVQIPILALGLSLCLATPVGWHAEDGGPLPALLVLVGGLVAVVAGTSRMFGSLTVTADSVTYRSAFRSNIVSRAAIARVAVRTVPGFGGMRAAVVLDTVDGKPHQIDLLSSYTTPAGRRWLDETAVRIRDALELEETSIP